MSLLRSYQLERGTLKGSAHLSARVRSAVLKAAVAVHAEEPGTVNHAARLQWAKLALQDPDTYGERMLAGVCANPTIVAAGGNALDGDIEFTVNSLVDGYAPYLEESALISSPAMADLLGDEPPSTGLVARFRSWSGS